jgi:hypothetical protein
VIIRTLVVALLFSGCFGLAHTAVEMPPLVVQGVLLAADGQPVVGEAVTVALSDFYAQPETLSALTSGAFAPGAHGYRFCAVRSGSDGDFSCRLSGESRYIGFMPPLMCPGESTLKSFLVGIRTADGSSFAIDVSGSDAEIRVPVGPEFKLAKPNGLPYAVEATPSRSAGTDVLQVVIRKKPAA